MQQIISFVIFIALKLARGRLHKKWWVRLDGRPAVLLKTLKYISYKKIDQLELAPLGANGVLQDQAQDVELTVIHR